MIQNGGAIDEGRDWQETFTQVAKDFFLKSVVVPQIPHATGKLKIMPIRGQGETGKYPTGANSSAGFFSFLPRLRFSPLDCPSLCIRDACRGSQV